jgi:hypothetical protein
MSWAVAIAAYARLQDDVKLGTREDAADPGIPSTVRVFPNKKSLRQRRRRGHHW